MADSTAPRATRDPPRAAPSEAEAALHGDLLEAVELHRRGEFARARAIYGRILDAAPDHADATHFLGLALYQMGEREAARAPLERSLALNPGSADYHNNCASVLQDCGEHLGALRHAETALRLRPGFAEAYNNLGCARLGQGRPEAALPHFRAALAVDPDFADAHNNLGAALQGMGRLDEAVGCYRRALLLAPESAPAWNNLGDALCALERIDEADSAYRRAYELAPSDALDIKLALLLPTIYRSEADLAAERSRLSDEVDALLARGTRLSDPLREVNAPTFAIAYQGRDDRDLMGRIARLFRPHLPEFQPPANAPAPGARLRVGFVSSFWADHSVALIYRDLVERLAALDLDVTLFAAGRAAPRADPSAGSELDVVRLPANLDAARRIVADRGLDALVYADIGMDPFTYFLAFTRLAPIQCVLGGHPVTTGIPTVDYYLSQVDQDRPDGQERYAETLIRLEHIPTLFRRPTLPARPPSREALRLPGAGALYVCPMMLFKFHPAFDAVWGEILRRDPEGWLILFRDRRAPHLHEALARRFARSMPDVASRVVFRRFAPADEFLSLLMRADVMLDTHPFGGGTTHYLAFAAGTPIVTLPGPDQRGRVAYSCYRAMGLEEGIAADADDYVEIAVGLGTDPARREALARAIRARAGVLFDNTDGADDLAAFLRAVVRERREAPR